MKSSGRNFIFLVLYVDDILLASTDRGACMRQLFLSSNFDIKDLGEASYVLGIEINIDRPKHLLGLSQHSYISKVLKRFEMHTCSPGPVPISKGDKLNK